MSSIKFADGTIIESFSKPYIIAEVNSSHNGDIQIAKKMVDAAKNAGCDCVKFQSWSAKTLYSKTYYQQNPIAKRFVDKLSLTPDELWEMAEYCKYKEIAFSSTPYSRDEVDFLTDKCKVPFVKIASMEVNNPMYIEYIAKKGVPIVLSTGMAEYDEVEKAVDIIEKAGNKNIAILHCVSVYPTPLEKANLRNIQKLQTLFPKYPIGFSDHTLGDTAAIAATAIGAAIIEKHITLDAKKIGMDNQMAMEPDALELLVKKCKDIPTVLGTEKRVIFSEELTQREKMRRSVVVTRDINAGEVLRAEDLDAKRPGNGIAPEQIPLLIGCKVKRCIEADSILLESDVDR